MTMPPHTARDAVWTVLSDARLGAAPVLDEVRDGVLRELARGEPIGLRHRWPNPVGAGDPDGDGELEFAWFARGPRGLYILERC